MASLALRTVLGAAMTSIRDTTSTNSTSTGNGESSTSLLNDRINLIAATTLLGFTYGVMTSLYLMSIYSLFKKLFRHGTRSGSYPQSLTRSRTEWRKTLFYIVYTSTLFALATVYTAANSQNAIIAYVDNRLYPGGPYQYFVMFMAGQNSMVMTDIASLIILWMTDALILCRFIAFYYNIAYARWIIPLPFAMYVGVVVLSTLVLQGEAGLGRVFYLSENMMLAYYSLSFSLSVIATVLIAARLYWHKVQLQRVFGPNIESPYMSIATILIESASLYGTWSLVFLILCVLNSPGQTLVLAMVPQIQVISPLLIILWIARGKAWRNGRGFRDDDDEAPAEPHPSGSGRLSFGSRPARIAEELGLDDVRPRASQNASRNTVARGDCDTKHEHNKVNVIELGVCSSEPSSIIDDLKM